MRKEVRKKEKFNKEGPIKGYLRKGIILGRVNTIKKKVGGGGFERKGKRWRRSEREDRI